MKHRHITPTRLCHTLALVAALCVSAPMAQAQNEEAQTEEIEPVDKERMFDQPAPAAEDYGPSEEEPDTGPTKVEISDAPSVMPNYGYQINFVHKDGTAPNEAILRITFPLSVTGCYNVIPAETETRLMGRQFEILFTDPVVKMDETPSYGHNTCDSKTASVVKDVIIDRDVLIENDVNKFSLRSSMGQEQYDVLVNKDQLALFTKYKDSLTNKDKRIDWHGDKVLFKPYEGNLTKTPLTYWFYPENTVVLSVPMAKPNSDLSAEIKKFAQSRGMIALKAMVPAFKPPTDNKNKLYFIDQVGTLAQTLDTQGASIGTITIGETFYGPKGAYQRAKNLEVMASAPGTME